MLDYMVCTLLKSVGSAWRVCVVNWYPHVVPVESNGICQQGLWGKLISASRACVAECVDSTLT